MTKTLLSVALAVSVMINLALLRRDPPVDPAPKPPATASRAGSSAAASRTADAQTDVLFLREEVRKLQEQLTITRVRHKLEKNIFSPAVDDPTEQPEVREIRELMERVASFVEMRETEGRDEKGRPVILQKPVLTPGRRQSALKLLEEYVALDGEVRSAFRDLAQNAVAAYYRAHESFERELHAAKKAAENDEFFEDANVRNQAIHDRMSGRNEEWMRDHVRPLRDLLDRRTGVRPALLSDNLAGLLMQLGRADER